VFILEIYLIIVYNYIGVVSVCFSIGNLMYIKRLSIPLMLGLVTLASGTGWGIAGQPPLTPEQLLKATVLWGPIRNGLRQLRADAQALEGVNADDPTAMFRVRQLLANLEFVDDRYFGFGAVAPELGTLCKSFYYRIRLYLADVENEISRLGVRLTQPFIGRFSQNLTDACVRFEGKVGARIDLCVRSHDGRMPTPPPAFGAWPQGMGVTFPPIVALDDPLAGVMLWGIPNDGFRAYISGCMSLSSLDVNDPTALVQLRLTLADLQDISCRYFAFSVPPHPVMVDTLRAIHLSLVAPIAGAFAELNLPGFALTEKFVVDTVSDCYENVGRCIKKVKQVISHLSPHALVPQSRDVPPPEAFAPEPVRPQPDAAAGS
jgi:hypothetical protein